ncbi:MAG TPA: FAD-dependent oxidoreductase [Candidatus Acidoferrales bacterium]
MTDTRRDFLKFVVSGSVAAGCPINFSLLSAAPPPLAEVDGDHFQICHQVRDGKSFAEQPISKRYDVVIVGGGVSGLSAAYFLRDQDFLLLEKEPHWGGNAYREEYHDQGFATGSAFDVKGSASQQIAEQIGLKLLPIDNPDPSIIGGKWIPDLWRAGLDHLPYPVSVREGFKKFRASVLKLDTAKDAAHLDSVSLSQYLKDYPAEIKQWYDAYGPSNWGADADNTSLFVAVDDFKYINGPDDPRLTLPGGNGALAAKLTATLQAAHAERMMADATIVSVVPQKSDVHITYFAAGELRTVAARHVVMATPKFFTARLVSGLPDAQHEAMLSYRYCPYPVINMIFDRPVYNRAYDTWCPGKSFSDFIVADWVLQKQPGYVQENNILTFYTPLPEAQRHTLLQIPDCQQLAVKVLDDFRKLQPEFASAEPIEVHLHRRGHPMFLPTPGTFTKVIPAANRPLDRVYFANTDSIGPISEISGAVEAAQAGAEWVKKKMAGASVSAAAPPSK